MRQVYSYLILMALYEKYCKPYIITTTGTLKKASMRQLEITSEDEDIIPTENMIVNIDIKLKKV